MADPSITQLMQQKVSEAERNTVFGVQATLSHSFSMLKDLFAFILPDPRTFGLLMIGSVFCVATGFASYFYYLYKASRKQAFQISKSAFSSSDSPYREDRASASEKSTACRDAKRICAAEKDERRGVYSIEQQNSAK